MKSITDNRSVEVFKEIQNGSHEIYNGQRTCVQVQTICVPIERITISMTSLQTGAHCLLHQPNR